MLKTDNAFKSALSDYYSFNLAGFKNVCWHLMPLNFKLQQTERHVLSGHTCTLTPLLP